MSQFHKPNREMLDAELAKDRREVAEQSGPRPHKLQAGVTEIRILPPYNESGAWYRELREYYFDVDGQTNRFTSPSQFGLPDPIAEKRNELMEAGGVANLTLAKEMREQRAFLYNVIIKSAPPGVEFVPGQVYVLKTGVKLKRALLNHDGDEQGGWNDITNPEQGVTFRITKSGKGFKTDYQLQTLPTRTRLEDDLNAVGMGMIGPENLYNLDELFPPMSEQEIRMRLLGVRVQDQHEPGNIQQAQQVAQPVQQQPVQQAVQQPVVAAAAPVQQPGAPQPQPVQQQPVQQQPVQQQPVQQQPVQQQPQQVQPQPVQQAALPAIPAPPPVTEE
jgi:hypothetical protein